MPNSHAHHAVMVAGGSGLVGSELIKQLLDSSAIERIYALSRKPLVFQSPKLHAILSADLQLTEWQEDDPLPTLGFICLGTTRQQAGSKQSLEKVDYELVCKVAQEMKLLGIQKIAIVSSLGAAAHSASHYLRCKGKMEQTVRQMGFRHVTFVRPGPLAGLRDTPRRAEQITNAALNIVKPLLRGPLQNLVPIHAADVAQTMIYSLFQTEQKKVAILHSAEMRRWLKTYR